MRNLPWILRRLRYAFRPGAREAADLETLAQIPEIRVTTPPEELRCIVTSRDPWSGIPHDRKV